MQNTSQGKAFALYRLPGQQEAQMVQEGTKGLLTFTDIAQYGGEEGFLVAPFYATTAQPIVLIPGRAEAYSLQSDLPPCHAGPAQEEEGDSLERYREAFGSFHQALNQGRFSKLVLARRRHIASAGLGMARELFAQACQAQPHAMVCLVSAPQCGTWLMATPEVLLRAQGSHCHTMALAGTMATGPAGAMPATGWSHKNCAEQQLVAQFVDDKLKQFSPQVHHTAPHTVRAGHLVHLRTDFHCTLSPGVPLGRVIAALHPTPAVCGLPQAQAMAFVLRHEGMSRAYYSGYAGLVGNSHTALFVTLRCMRLFPQGSTLYAGGGLLPESQLESEWIETEQKMKTMELCIAATHK